jgi:hypothetical protein
MTSFHPALSADAVPEHVPECGPASTLSSMPERLQDLNARAAQEFIGLAGFLQSIAGHARELATLSQQVTHLAAEGESGHAILSLQQILGDAEHLQTFGKTSREQLGEILVWLTRIGAPLTRLVKLRSTLQALGTLARIEGSRLKSTVVDVSTLAGDIDGLAEQTERQVAAITGETDELRELVVRSRRELDQREEQGRQQAADLVQRSRAVLGPLQARAEAAIAAARTIDDQYAGIRRATDKIVMSLQAEDIARQRVEHVQAVLQQASDALQAGGSLTDWGGIVVLQRSQLLGARTLLLEAVQAVLDSLQSLSPRVEALVGETEALSSQTDRDGRSFAAAIQDGAGAVTAILGQYSGSARAVLSAVDAVLPSITRMTKSANELEEIEASIHLIGLNAAVKTAHLGVEGAAMSVLALELQKIKMQTEESTHAVRDALVAMDQARGTISSRSDSFASSILTSSGSAGVEQELSRLAELGVRSSEKMSVQLAALLELAVRLRTELQGAGALAKHAKAIGQSFDEVLGELQGCLGRYGYKPDRTMGSGDGDQATDLASRYSMQSERDAHEQVFGGEEGPRPEVAGSATDAEDDLGDNVELF